MRCWRSTCKGGCLWSKIMWGETVPVAPKPDISTSLWGIFCLQQRSALCPAGDLLRAGAGLSLHRVGDISCTGVFEMNVLISYIKKYIWNTGIWAMRCWSCWVVMPAVSSRLQWLGLVMLVSGGSAFFSPVLRQLPVIPQVCNEQSCWVSPFTKELHPLPTPLVSIISFYSEQSRISNYPELLNF